MTLSFHNVPEDEQSANKCLPSVGSPISRADAQQLALRIALWGVGQVAPNPMVGAVIVDQNHNFLAAGAHLKIGGPHAEIEAIRSLENSRENSRENSPDKKNRTDFSGCTLYVTLEPCSHQGRTPACAGTIIEKKFAKVVYGLPDPNPKVAGADAIRNAGIAVELDQSWSKACHRRAEFFLWQIKHKTPFVGIKAAISLDGAIARRGDQRNWITGARARAFGHFLRIKYDAIAIGSRTLLDDNPTLTPRDAVITGRTPWRVVIDPSGKGLLDRGSIPIKLAESSNDKVIWLLSPNAPDAVASQLKKFPHIHAVTLKTDDKGVFAPNHILEALAAHDITSVLLEGGSGLYRGFIEKGMVNRYHLFQSARILGGDQKVNFYDGPDAAFDRIPDDIELTPLGQDWLTEFSGRTNH